MRREFVREGLGYVLRVPELMIELGIDRLSRSRGETHGELNVSCGLPGTRSADGHIHQARFNLTSTTARTSVAKVLATRAAAPEVDWLDLLEDLCRRVLAADREGDPIEKIGALPVPVGESYRLDPILPLDQVTILYGDGGCVAGETLLDGPDGPRRMDDLAATGRPVQVWALDSDARVRAVEADAPFAKGVAALYRFDLASGRSITVMETHRFLTPEGWRFARDLAPGAVLCGSAPGLPATSSAPDRGASGPGAPGWTRTPAGSSDRCDPSPHRHGPRPLSAGGAALALAPSQGDARGRIRVGRHEDARSPSRAGNRPCRPSPRPSRSGSAPVSPSLAGAGSHGESSPAALTTWSIRDRRPSQRVTAQLLPTPGSDLRGAHGSVDGPSSARRAPRPADSRLSSWVPPVGRLYLDTVTAVSYVRTDVYYDLHVPGPENYLANGVWNHNTGKSTLAVAIAVSVNEGVAVIEHWIPRQAPVLYLDWEAGRGALNRRVRGVAMGARIPRVVQIDYLNCRRRGPLHAFAEDISRAVDREGYGLVVVDSVGMASGTGGDGGDANETAIRLFGAFGYLGCTVLAIDHINRTDADLPTKRSRPYGSVYKTNLARATFELRRSADSSTLGIYHTKANDAALMAPQALEIAYGDDGSITYERQSGLPTELAAPLSLTEQIIVALRGGPMTSEELSIELGHERKRVEALLYKKTRVPRFGRLASGRWELLPEAVSHAV